jgi:DEAD/DEAH box helicase domain-containing protein
MSVPYRVTRIFMRQRTVKVRREKYYTTKPTAIPTLIYPNLTEGNVYGAVRLGDLRLIESSVQVNSTIIGFRERRGPNQFAQSYPLDPALGFFFDQPRFERNFFSTGVLLLHPRLSGESINRQVLATLLFEGFLMEVPFERQDLDFGADRFRSTRLPELESQPFICVYDQTYGSLRLNRRLMDVLTLRGALAKALEIARSELVEPLLDETVNNETVDLLEVLVSESAQEPVPFELCSTVELPSANAIPVILPGSVGVFPEYGNEEYRVDDIRFTSRGLVYRGKRLSQQGSRFAEVEVVVPVDRITAIPGRSEIGFYDPDTDTVNRTAT